MSLDTSSASSLLDRLLEAPESDRARLVTERGDACPTISMLVECAERITLEDVNRADAATHVVVQLADGIGTHLERARARRARAKALSYIGRYHDALSLCHEGIELASLAGSAIDAARTRLASMHALGELGRLDDAIAEGERARQAFLAAGEASLAARADINIGIAWQRRDHPARAIACFARARPLVTDEPMLLGPLENNRGEALLAVADFDGAERAFSSALHAFQLSGSRLAAAIAEGNLADLAARQGRLQKAMFHFEQARRSLEQDAASGHLARLLAEQADAMAVLGLPRDALREYEAALSELDRQGLKLEAARARHGMGLALLRLHRHAQAETALAAAATAFDELRHATARARVDIVRAQLALLHGRHADARSMALHALAAAHDRPTETARVRLVLGQLADTLGQDTEADAEFNQGLALARDVDLAPLQAELHLARGRMRMRQRRVADAVTDFTAAVEHVERVRSTLQADRFRAAFSGERVDAYIALVQALLETDDAAFTARAFAVAEQARSRSLLEQMQNVLHARDSDDLTEGQTHDDAITRLLTEREHIRADLNAMYSQLADNRRIEVATSASSGHTWRQQIRDREQRLDDIESRLATTREHRQGVARLFAPVIDLANALQSVPADSALIEFMICGEEIVALVLHNGKCHTVRQLGTRSQLASHAQALMFQINRALRPGATDGQRGQRLCHDANRVLEGIGDMVLKPLMPWMGDAKRLIIVPYGLLHMIPFAALRVDGRFMLDAFDVHAAPSATVHAQLLQQSKTRTPTRHTSSVVVGVNDEFAPDIVNEAQSVAQKLEGAKLLIGADASVHAVLDHLPEAKVIHMACHGRFLSTTPMASGLRLADRWLTVRDIYQLKLQAELVTLSGCETGVNLVKAGDELMGLTRGILAAGASAVLATLWRIDDRISRHFMECLYDSWGKLSDSLTKARLLHDTQRMIMQRHPHPAYWAPFFLVGHS